MNPDDIKDDYTPAVPVFDMCTITTSAGSFLLEASIRQPAEYWDVVSRRINEGWEAVRKMEAAPPVTDVMKMLYPTIRARLVYLA